jgi:Zn-dependent peptidase ImmA (M78 family)
VYQALEPIVEGIAMATGFPLTFFRDDPVIDFPPGSLLYRKRATLKSSHKATLRQISRLLLEIGLTLGRQIGTVSPKLPDTTGDPRRDARLVRRALGFSSDEPITNLIRSIEKTGVFVIALWLEVDEHDAFSVWAKAEQPKPVLVVSSGKSGDRLRFSLSHELGHLVLHRGIVSGTKMHERQADTFASELLMPAHAMKTEMIPPLNLTKLADLKARWGVSMQALLMRALHLEIITTRQYKYLMQQLAAKGWRTKEPVEIPAEKPRLLRQLIERAYGIPVPISRVAEELKLPEKFVQQLLETHAGQGPLLTSRAGRKLLRFNVPLN